MYFGGKQRVARKLSAVIAGEVQRRKSYVEPFVGGGSMMVEQCCESRIGGDANVALINMWVALSRGWRPPNHVDFEQYQRIKLENNADDPMTAFVGFGCSFAGKWFAGYARGGVDRNYAKNAASSLSKKIGKLHGVKWRACDYRSLQFPSKSVIYCDPPYSGTTQYGAVGNFCTDEFWSWCRVMHNDGCAIFVSEYNAPDDFIQVASVNTRTDIRTVAAGGQEQRIERLFIPVGAEYEIVTR